MSTRINLAKSIFIGAVVLLICAQWSRAADPSFERGIVFIRNELRIAATGVRAMAVAAHPDDEDGATLSYLREAGCETHICFCTRGEGGQNEAGPEVGAQLACMRTREIDEACAILGAKPWFLNLPDFGFSKSPDEAMKVWNHDVALERMVRIIRRVRPHIIITNHNPDGTDHGHHRAAGKLLVEAFDAAANAEKFPDQIKKDGLKPWTIERIYLRHFSPENTTLTLDVSKRDGLAGTSASEIGAFSLSRHFSQGMLRTLKAGERELRYFSILKSNPASDTKLAALLDSTLSSEIVKLDAGAFPLAGKIDATAARTILAAGIENGDRAPMNDDARNHYDRALAEALGLKIEVHAEDEYIVAGEKSKISVRVANTGPLALKLNKISFAAESPKWTLSENSPAKELKPGDAETLELEIGAMAGAPLNYPPEEHLFSREESRMPVTAVADFAITHPASGKDVMLRLESEVPLGLAAPYSFYLSPQPNLIFADKNLGEVPRFKLIVTRNRKGNEPLYLAGKFGPKPQLNVENKEKIVTLNSKGGSAVFDFSPLVSEEDLTRGDVIIPTHVWDKDEFYETPALTVRRVQLDMPANVRVALVKGIDEQTFNALKGMQRAGVAHGTFTVETPTDRELWTQNLNEYQAIILDIRSTQQRQELRHMKERLMAFMREGGTVVCMYQKDFDWNDHAKEAARGVGFFRGKGGGGQIAPHPIELSFDRITDENAPVRIIAPNHPLMLRPSRIWPQDFEGWVQERGAYFPKKWADEYTAVLSSNDPGEKALDGGLLVSDVGRGAFIYTSYFWHTQLRNGVPGAYRMLVNMMCYSRMKRENEK